MRSAEEAIPERPLSPSPSPSPARDSIGVARSADLYRRLVGAQIQSQMQYRLSFALDLLSTGLITLVEFAAIAFVFQRFDSLGGWTLGEVALLYGMVAVAFKTMDMLFAGFDPSDFGQSVRLGGFDQLMLRPIGLALQVLGSRFTLHRIGAIAQGLVILLIAIRLVDVDWSAAKVLHLLVVIASQILFFGALFIIGSTITFWTIDSIEAINIFTYGGQEMLSFPMHIYHPWMRRFFTYIVPGVFLNYAPVVHLLSRPEPLGLGPLAPFLAPFVGVLAMALALTFWRIGVRHYQSTGT